MIALPATGLGIGAAVPEPIAVAGENTVTLLGHGFQFCCPSDVVAAGYLNLLPLFGLDERGPDRDSLAILLEVAWQQHQNAKRN